MNENKKKCYYLLKMTVQPLEVFDVQGKLVFTQTEIKEVVLHSAQKNTPAVYEKIKNQMWNDFLTEKKWTPINKTSYNKFVVFNSIPIPRKSAPITYKF